MQPDQPPPPGSMLAGWKRRWIGWRNGVIGNSRFQRWAAANPLTRTIAQRRAGGLFDLVAGFTYSQTLSAAVESGVIELLAAGPVSLADAGKRCGLSEEAAALLLRASAAIDLAQEVEPGVWMLGQQGAALRGNAGVLAMIRHHRLLYADLADPLALLRRERSSPTALSDFWTYAGEPDPAARDDCNTRAYSELMASSQAMVVEQVLAAYRFDRHRSLLDVGGGYGVFATAVAAAYPALNTGIFDLPDVLRHHAGESTPVSRQAPTLHPGDFFRDPIPTGYDCISLVRILHDHDDAPAADLLSAIHESLEHGATLLIAEPMAGTRGARKMGDAYFGLYLWAMRSGRPRRADEIGAMLNRAGFRDWRRVATDLPVITSLIVATA
ncbi:methyltransferase [Erythrobacter sp. QSSC1-22B]|uniref:methyltransferase n=1 Tax=Erythrobacter sp. QSSC1-22B TaxID=1860125 RepID=UPI001F46E36A|nr:methyltransferase [Erythrobacter sp. QSSC1-22B]